jgi:hypothetical protein
VQGANVITTVLSYSSEKITLFWDRCYYFIDIYAEKLAPLTQNTVNLYKKWIMTLAFFSKNWENR